MENDFFDENLDENLDIFDEGFIEDYQNDVFPDQRDVLGEFIAENYVDDPLEKNSEIGLDDIIDESFVDVLTEETVETPIVEIFEGEPPDGIFVEGNTAGIETIDEIVNDGAKEEFDEQKIAGLFEAQLEEAMLRMKENGDFDGSQKTDYLNGLGKDYEHNYDQILEDAKKQDKNYGKLKVESPFGSRGVRSGYSRSYHKRFDDQEKIMRGGYSHKSPYKR